MFDWLRKAAGAVGNAVNQGASFVARPYQQTFNQVSRGADDARRRLLEQQRAAAQAAQQARQQAQQQAQVNAQRLQQAVPKLNMGAAMSALGKVGMAANPANQFKAQINAVGKVAPKINFGQYGQAIQKDFNKSNAQMGGLINRALDNPVVSGAVTPYAAPLVAQHILRKPGGALKFAGEQIAAMASAASGNTFTRSAGELTEKDLRNGLAERNQKATGNAYRQVAPGVYAPQDLSRAKQIANPVIAGITVAGLRAMPSSKVVNPVTRVLAGGAEQGGIGTTTGVVQRYGNTNDARKAFDPVSMATDFAGSALIGGLFNVPGALKLRSEQSTAVQNAGKKAIQDFNAPQIAKNLAEKGRLQAEGFTNVKVAKIGNVAQATPSPTVNQNVAKQALIHPEDQRVMNDLVAMNNGSYRPDAKTAQELELASSRIMEHYNLVHPDGVPVKDINGLAQTFQNVLESTDVPGRKAIKVPQFNQDAPQANPEALLKKAGYKLNKDGDWIDPKGKEADFGEMQQVIQPKKLTQDENLIAQGKMKYAQAEADTTKIANGAPIYETAPKPNVPTKTRGFVKTVKASEEVSDDVKKSVSGTYTPKQNSELVANADKFVKSKNAEKVLHDQLAVKAGNIDDQTIANAVTFAKKQDTLGNHDAASNIYDQLSEHLTQKGREIQAASLLSRRTPEGLQFSAQRLLKKSGVEMTPLIKKEIQANVTAIKATKLGTEQRDLAIAKMKSDLMKHIPQGTLDNLTSTWKAGLLSGVKTQGGNALSNSTFGIMKLTSNPVSAVADKAMSLFTGKRKFALTDRGLASGGLEGAKKGAYTLKTGIDARRISGVSDKYEQFSEINFKNKWVNKLVGTPSNLVFRGMSAADQPYYYAALKNSLYDQALAEGKNQGIKGVALRKFMKDKVQNADNSMVQTAVHDAEKAILGFDTVMSRIVSYAHKSIETAPISEAGKQSANATINAIAPFTKVPSAFLSRTVDYTPFGPIKTIIGQVSKKQFDQRALSQAIGEGVTGTGLIVLGSQLARADLLSGDYPKTDQKEQARWKAEGITQNSVKIGPNWVSLNYLGPLGLLFGAGKSFVDAEKKGASAMDTASSVVAGFGSGLLQQSFLQGLSGFINALNEPGRFMNNYVKQFAGSVVPSWINDIGNLTDKYKRQSTSIPEATMARIPGLRTNLKEQTDVFGNKLEQGGVNTINPFKPSPDTSNTLTNELDRLAGVSKDYNVWPTPPNNSDFFGKDTNVDYNQIKQIQADLGAQIQTAWQETMASQDYMSKDDRGKVELLTKVKRDITDTFKQQNASKYGQTITPKIAKVAKPKTARKSRRVASKRGRTGTSRGRVASIAKSKQPKFKSVRIARGTAPKISKTPRLKLRSYT